jgi:large subunit ribosomal protein L5e
LHPSFIMGFVKVIKNKAYFKRFQVKFRRRREGKTDYRQRKRLVTQDKTKYNSPKYRLVVRITNGDIICQIVEAKIIGDSVLAVAYAHELTRYGMPVGHTNYAAAYATGLLVARRVLTKFNLADKYVGKTEVNGEDYNVEEIPDAPRPFFALLDVGLRRTTTGARVFAAMKGAADGGIEIPHSDRRLVGYDAEEKKFKPEVLRKHLFAGHVADYMKLLKEQDEDQYKSHFSKYIEAGLSAETLESTWAKVHKAIRDSPALVKSQKKVEKPKSYRTKKSLSLAQRKDRVKQKLAARAKAETQE